MKSAAAKAASVAPRPARICRSVISAPPLQQAVDRPGPLAADPPAGAVARGNRLVDGFGAVARLASRPSRLEFKPPDAPAFIALFQGAIGPALLLLHPAV